MISLMICGLIAVALFVSAYIAKRRFGLLGLALASGSLLSVIWAYDAGLVVSIFGISPSKMVSAITSMVIILLPAFVLLFHGYTYKGRIGRFIGAGLFMALAMAFLVEPLGQMMKPSGFGVDLYDWLVNNKSLIIGSGLIAAVVDIFLTKPIGDKKKR